MNLGNKSVKFYCPLLDASIHRLLKMIIIQAIKALTDLRQHILYTCTVLNCVIVLKFDMLQ